MATLATTPDKLFIDKTMTTQRVTPVTDFLDA